MLQKVATNSFWFKGQALTHTLGSTVKNVLNSNGPKKYLRTKYYLIIKETRTNMKLKIKPN